MNVSKVGLLGFVVFLGVYAYVKYTAAAPPVFVPGYAANVAILVALTGIAPFLASIGVAKFAGSALPMRIVVTTIAGVILCVGAYALFFKIFIEGAAPGANIIDVARRGVGWGAIQGALAALTIGAKR
jgi:hypothetical protein